MSITEKLTLSLALIALLSGCNRTSIEDQTLSPQSVNLNTVSMKENSITTTQDNIKVEVIGELGAKVFLNNQEMGEIPENGKLVINIGVDEIGTHYYNIYTIDKEGKKSENKVLKVIKKAKSSELGRVSTKGEVAGLTVSKEKIAFLAEKGDGVEIVGIGFNDTVSSDLLSTIDIDAYGVVLSDNGKKLYIKDKNGVYSIVDISNISDPKIIGSLKELPTRPNEAKTKDSKYTYYKRACGIGLKTPTDNTLLIKDKFITDVVIVEDKYILASHGKEGLYLYDISDRTHPKKIGTKEINGVASALSVLEDDGILFVANKKGVDIYNLDILLHEMGAK